MKRHRSKYVAAFCLVVLLCFVQSPIGGSTRPTLAREGGNRAADFDTVRTDLDDYIWPTDASRRITSSFAEFRSNHFHGGIDISTNQITGYKVFAVRDGYVYRIRITPNGYGKMLYVKHNDGYVSTYAHLKTFNDDINQVAREEQYQRGTYSIDLILDSLQIPVRQGDVIAYTGDTGFGPAHLHFELRDENLNPLNPMLSAHYRTMDNIPPTIHRLMVNPLGYGSTVDGGAPPRYYSRFPRSRGWMIIPQTIRVHGRVGFGIEAQDKSDGTWSRAGIHRIELYVDDSLTYEMELNRVPAEETKQIELHYDLPTLARGYGRFQKLYIDAGNVLPFYFHRPAGTGIVNTDMLSEGKHKYRIACLDNQGNRSVLEGELFANHKPALRISNVENNEVILAGEDVSSIEKCIVYGKRAFQPKWTQHTLAKGRFEVRGSEVVLPVNTRLYDVVKVVVETKLGSSSPPMFRFVKKPLGPPRAVHVDYEILNEYLRFTVTTPGVFTETPVLTVQEGSLRRTVELDAMDVNKYVGALIPSEAVAGRRTVEVDAEVNGKPASTTDEVVVYPIPADRSGSFVIDSNLTVKFDSAAVYRPLYMTVKSDDTKRGLVYTLEPSDVLLNRGIMVSLPFSRAQQDNREGLYFRSTGGWVFETSQPDSCERTISTTITRRLGDIAIFQDDAPPSFGRLRVQPRRGTVYVSFRYLDDLSGVDPDEIKMYIDEKLVIPEIDGEHRFVSYHGDEPLGRGKHSLRIAMKDRARNENEVSRTFSIR